MKIYVLIEDTPVAGYKTEHGLSLLIENGEKHYLLDAGTTDAFLANAEKMGLDAGNVECSILSHGHYDHSGGYGTYLTQNPNVKVYAMACAEGEYYSGTGGRIHEVGVPKDVLPVHRDKFIFINEKIELDAGVYLIPHSTKGLEALGERATLYKKCGETYVPDDFAHEQSLVFDTEKGLVIFNSCSHAGVQNIIEEVKYALPGKKISAFVGGLHMKGKVDGAEVCIFTEDEVRRMAEYLKNEGVEKLYTGHCTGNVAFEMLQKHLGNRIGKLNTGECIVV